MDEYLQLAIACMIVGLVLFSVWRHGRLNPESTGRLANRIKRIEAAQAEQGAKLGSLEGALRELSEEMVRKGDLDAVRVAIDRDRETSERTWDAVSRLQWFFMNKGMNGGGS